MTPSPRAVAGALAALFLALHLPFQPISLEDLDSINFALGVRQFDVAEHQPHPPGYPLFMLAAKGVSLLVSSELRALSLIGVIAGALAAFALMPLFGTLENRSDGVGQGPLVATLLTMTSPLFWFTSSRPLSDMAGLTAALAIQAMTLASRTPGRLIATAAVAGVCAGIRSQVVWLTVPLLLLAIVWQPSGRWRVAGLAAAAYLAGVLVWAVPLVVVSGGPATYWRALSTQGAEDLSGVTMLWTTPTVRQLARALYYAFVAPWAVWPIAAGILAFAVIGSVRSLKARRALVTLAVAFGPYLIFDLLFQETITTRYALPLVVPVAYFATGGMFVAPKRLALTLGAAVVAFNAAITTMSLHAYSGAEAPAFRMLADMHRADAARSGATTPVLAMHRRQGFDLRRPIRWVGDAMPTFTRRLTTPPKHEWLELVKYWNEGGRDPIWFVADPPRSDLALFEHGRPRGSYRWPFNLTELIGGVRPNDMDWYVIDPPGWYLGEGWALTPESAGVAQEDGRGPGRGSIQGWIRRHAGASTLMVGGRNLADGGTAATLRVDLDGRPIDQITVPPGFFLRIATLDAGSLTGAGDYAAIAVRSDRDHVAVEQFDSAPAGRVVFGFGDGWHEQEYNPTTGRLWRWTSDRATLRVRAEGHALTLELRGDLEAASSSRVTIRAGDRSVAEQDVGRSFSIRTKIPAELLRADESTITVESTAWYVPAERSGRSRDRRRLGLKIYQCQLTPAF